MQSPHYDPFYRNFFLFLGWFRILRGFPHILYSILAITHRPLPSQWPLNHGI